jgi:hypothetical protein
VRLRVFVAHCEERAAFGFPQRAKAIKRVRTRLEKHQRRVARGRLKMLSEKIGADAMRHDYPLRFSRRDAARQALHHAAEPHQILTVRSAMTGCLAPKRVLFSAIGKALLGPTRRAFAVNVSQPWLTAVNPAYAQVKAAGRAWDEKGVGDLELESATRVTCQGSVELILMSPHLLP